MDAATVEALSDEDENPSAPGASEFSAGRQAEQSGVEANQEG